MPAHYFLSYCKYFFQKVMAKALLAGNHLTHQSRTCPWRTFWIDDSEHGPLTIVTNFKAKTSTIPCRTLFPFTNRYRERHYLLRVFIRPPRVIDGTRITVFIDKTMPDT